jgi:hypothetical protein
MVPVREAQMVPVREAKMALDLEQQMVLERMTLTSTSRYSVVWKENEMVKKKNSSEEK